MGDGSVRDWRRQFNSVLIFINSAVLILVN